VSYRNAIFLATLLITVISFPAGAVNSVFIESKTVLRGATGVTIGIYVDNDEDLRALVLPLELRSLTPGSYIFNSFSFNTQGRVAASGLMDLVVVSQLPFPDINNSCSGPVSKTYFAGNPVGVDFVSPDAAFWVGLITTSPCLSTGSDGLPGIGTPSFLFSFDVSSTAGTFEIDMCCVTPANHLAFVYCTPLEELIPQFTKGVITIAGDSPDLIADLDIKPSSYPNPLGLVSVAHGNGRSGGILPVAILGSHLFDVNSIDPKTIRLEGVAPVRHSFEDVSRPVADEDSSMCPCARHGVDGHADLNLKFPTAAIVATLDEAEDGATLVLTLDGALTDGSYFTASDCVVIRSGGLACHADPICDGVTDVFDVLATVGIAFQNTAQTLSEACGKRSSDVNCDGITNVFDVLILVDVALRNGNSSQFCDPCE